MNRILYILFKMVFIVFSVFLILTGVLSMVGGFSRSSKGGEYVTGKIMNLYTTMETETVGSGDDKEYIKVEYTNINVDVEDGQRTTLKKKSVASHWREGDIIELFTDANHKYFAENERDYNNEKYSGLLCGVLFIVFGCSLFYLITDRLAWFKRKRRIKDV